MQEIKLLKATTVAELREKIEKFEKIGWKVLERQERTMCTRYGQDSHYAGKIYNWAVIEDQKEE